MSRDRATIAGLLARPAAKAPGAIAILAPGRQESTHGALARHLEATARQLRAAGVGPRDRVVLALGGGPEAATAFLAVASSAAAAPLNPDYQAAEFDFYLGDLEPRALIVGQGVADRALAPARARGIAILWVRPDGPAGHFTLEPERAQKAPPRRDEAPRAEDIALLLHTSGTTARPKLVPLTHGNLLASARAVAETLRLSPADRCLNIMPLFHIHGLLAGLLAPLHAGGSVVCPPGFHAIEFFAWLDAFQPTWFTGVPSMHQAIVARADSHRATLDRSRLRFIRSSSAALAPRTLEALEAAFHVPVIEAYGMTEAAHQVASNPLPPAVRRPGSVGLAAGPEIAILGEGGRRLPRGRQGEVGIRGPSVTTGYLASPEANRAAFLDGWFRTGDEGFQDVDGYLFLTGRIKEIINRGGEKIAPREVEEVLLSHPAVLEAAVFAVPDRALGEEVGAAVVLNPGAHADAVELREFAGQRLAWFKTPRHLVLVETIPKGATGKVQRAGLAKALGLAGRGEAAAPDRTPPRDELEAELASLWREVLALDELGVMSMFLDLGGDSVLAAQLVGRARERFRVDLTPADVFDTPTVATMAARIAEKQARGPQSVTPPAHEPEHEPAPLSFSQEWWRSLEDAGPPSAASNRPSSLLLAGPLDEAALERAFWEVIRRHGSLRTAFDVERGRHVQRVQPLVAEPLPRTDLSPLPGEERRGALDRLASDLVGRRFDPGHAPLWRAHLVRLTPAEHVLLFVVHHAVFDGWSMAVFVRELAGIYGAFVQGRPSPLPEPGLQYADVARWQRRHLTGSRHDALAAWWAERLVGAPRPPRLPFALERPAVPTFRGGHAERLVPASRLRQVRRLAREAGATLYMTCLAAFHALLARYSAEEDILTGCLVAGRERPETEAMIGLFFNAVPMRGDLSGDPAPRALIARTRDMSLGAMAHQEMPIARMVELAGRRPRSDESLVALVPILFQMRNLPVPSAEAAGVRFGEFTHPSGLARFDLTFDLVERGDGLALSLDHSLDYLGPPQAEALLRDFEAMLGAFVADPERPSSRLVAGELPGGSG